MDELVDSIALVRNPGALRRRLAGDGYLFFRGLLPVAQVHTAAWHITAQLCQGGWVEDRGTPSADRPPLDPLDALGDPAFRAALASPAFNRIPYLAELCQLIMVVLGRGAFCYPAKALRFIYPERLPGVTSNRYVHRDYAVSGVQDMLTTWVPLIDIPIVLGGLAVRPGSHLSPPQRPHVLDEGEHGWATADYRAGDVLVFHCLTAHSALPNRGSVPRLSGDFRWQRSDQIAPAQLVLDPAGDHEELFSQQFAREPWWQPVPKGLRLGPRERLSSRPPGPSRFFPVHPAWRSWRPPGGPVARRAAS
jgi:Phytanoyl-CoA dioxygenase (PhyH)